jgi:UDP-N-acetyl-D-galactosamine dehydrogenase
MGVFVAEKVIALLAKKKQGNIAGSKLLILGFAFKENCADTRNTQVAMMYRYFTEAGLDVSIFDPLVNAQTVNDVYNILIINKLADFYDAVVLAVAHDIFKEIKFEKYKQSGSILFDTKSAINRKLIDGCL